MTVEISLLILGILLLLATLSSVLANRLGVPVLLLFLVIGMLAGSEGIGGIAFDSPDEAQAIGSFALMISLFSGGLDTRWQAVKPVLAQGLVLSTFGVVITAALLAIFAKIMLGNYTSFEIGPRVGVTWLEAALIAAIVSSTDAAAVFSVYRSSPVQPRKNLRQLLELESGSNDPMAVLLTITLLGIMMQGDQPGAGLLLTLVGQLVIGGVIGGAAGWFGSSVCNQLALTTRGLYPMLALGTAATAFGAAHLAGGNSFLAVYLAGLVLGNRLRRGRADVIRFHDGFSWLMQILVFIMLGLLVFPSQLLPVAWVAVALAFFLMFVARPVAVILCYLPFRPKPNELAYVSWVGLRGSVPIVLATFPATYGVANADQIFHLVFFIVLTSVLVQGMSLVKAARWLKVTED